METAQDGSYTPLSRPLFVYVSNKAYAEKPQVAAFVDYYVDNDARHRRDGRSSSRSATSRSPSCEDTAASLGG